MRRIGLPRSAALVAAVMISLLSARSWADDTHRGEVTRVESDSFSMSTDGKTHSHSISSETKVWLNGEPSNLSRLRSGDQVKVTQDDSGKVVKIEITRGESRRGTRVEIDRNSDDAEGQSAQTRRGGLGVTVVGTRDDDGVYVQEVVPNSPAAKAGIRQGDYILSADGEDTDSPADLAEAVRSNRPGASIELRLWRDGERFTKQVNLTALSEVFSEEARAERRQERGDRYAERNEDRSDRFAERRDRRRYSLDEDTADNDRARREAHADYYDDGTARNRGERTGHASEGVAAFTDDIQRLERTVQDLSQQVQKLQQRLDRMARENGAAELQR